MSNNYDEEAKSAMKNAINKFKDEHKSKPDGESETKSDVQDGADSSSKEKATEPVPKDGKENQFTVESAKDFMNQGQYDVAISLFKKSKELCKRNGWGDGVRYAEEMIAKCEQESQQ